MIFWVYVQGRPCLWLIQPLGIMAPQQIPVIYSSSMRTFINLLAAWNSDGQSAFRIVLVSKSRSLLILRLWPAPRPSSSSDRTKVAEDLIDRKKLILLVLWLTCITLIALLSWLNTTTSNSKETHLIVWCVINRLFLRYNLEKQNAFSNCLQQGARAVRGAWS